MTPTSTTNQIEFARFAGELAESLSFNRSIGQIFGLLYLASEPLSLSDISQRLSMSKGNASINLRYLESWGAVRPVATGTRRDHYQANTNLKEIILRRVEEGISRRLDHAEERLAQIISNEDNSASLDPQAKKKIQDLKSLLSGGRKALKLLPTALKFLPK